MMMKWKLYDDGCWRAEAEGWLFTVQPDPPYAAPGDWFAWCHRIDVDFPGDPEICDSLEDAKAHCEDWAAELRQDRILSN